MSLDPFPFRDPLHSRPTGNDLPGGPGRLSRHAQGTHRADGGVSVLTEIRVATNSLCVPGRVGLFRQSMGSRWSEVPFRDFSLRASADGTASPAHRAATGPTLSPRG